MKRAAILANALAVVVSFGGCATVDTSAVPAESPLVCAHRGGRHEYDDNAVGGFVASLKAGVRGYETDVRETVDGELVIMHDAKVDRTTTSTGDITKMTLAEVRKLRLKKSGEPVPTLAEVLRPFAGRKDVWIELEMKSHQGDVDAYTRKIHDTAASILEPGTFAIIGFSPEHVGSVMRQFPDQKSSFTVARPLDERAIADAKRLGANGVGTFLKGTKKEMVDKAHAAGLRVAMWMINTKEEYELAKSLGADTVTSDYPIRLLTELRK